MRHDIYTLPEITLVAGQSETIQFNLFNEDGTKFKAYGLNGNFSVVDYSNQTDDPVISLSIIAPTSTSSNEVQVIIDSDETLGLYGKYIYQLTFKGANRTVDIPNQGIMFIGHNINEAFLRSQGV